jgi:Rrf2 family protein
VYRYRLVRAYRGERGFKTLLSMTKRADYALLALSHLALSASENPDRLINTKEIAEQYEIPVELLAKILQILAKNGLVASHPGPSGGYRLLRDAARISVGEVVAIVDGPLSLVHCSVGHETACKQYNRCTIRSPLATIEARVKSLLDNISLAELSQTIVEPDEAAPAESFARRDFAVPIPVG